MNVIHGKYEIKHYIDMDVSKKQNQNFENSTKNLKHFKYANRKKNSNKILFLESLVHKTNVSNVTAIFICILKHLSNAIKTEPSWLM